MPTRCDSMKIRAKMNEILMTPAQLAEASTLSTSTLNRILNEKNYRTSDATINLLAKALGCSPFDLLKDEAIGNMIHQEAEQAVTGVVAEAVAEALTVVVDELAPVVEEHSQQEIADAVPQMEVTTPPVLDVAAYVDYIRKSSEEKVELIQGELTKVRKSRTRWMIGTIVTIVLALAAVLGLTYYFIWEILHPDKGLTSILWKIYNSTTIPPVATPTPTPTIIPPL